MAKGIIKSTPTATRPRGQVAVIIADGNSHGVGQNQWLEYDNVSPDSLSDDDTVILTITSPTTCEVTRKFVASQGTVSVEMNGEQSRNKVMITQPESNDFGVKTGDILTFDSYPNAEGQYPGPPYTNWGDTIEVIVTGAESGVFVKVL